MTIEGKVLEDLRRRLLDISKRNRLLNFRFSESSRNHLRIVDELPDVIYSKLLADRPLFFDSLKEPEDEPKDEHTDRFLMALESARNSDEDYLKAMELLDEDDDTSAAGLRIERKLKDKIREQLSMSVRQSRETLTPVEIAVSLGLNPSYDLPRPTEVPSKSKAHNDDRVQTLLFVDQLERKLSGITDGARIAFSEMGVNILFVALGYLEWYESESSDQKLFAPLLLHPLKINRTLKKQKYQYAIQTYGEDTESNHTLREALLVDFGLALPDFDVETDTPEGYFESIEHLVAGEKRWRVRRFATIGLFPFSKIAMYHDLDPAKWPSSPGLLSNPILGELLSISSSGDSLHAEEHDVDGIESTSEAPLLIADADSSQYSTIVDVMRGANLAVKGPPGTGKSQTITNIIAAAMAKGLRILFVAEKMAALEVVKNRLDNVGVGIYCLELHSTKANKKSVLESLSSRLDERQKTTRSWVYPETIRELHELRQRLASYVELLNQPFGHSGASLNEIIWTAIRSRDVHTESGLPVSINHTFLVAPDRWTQADIDIRKLTLSNLKEAASGLESQYGSVTRGPFWGLSCPDLTPFDEESLSRCLRDLHALSSELLKVHLAIEEGLGGQQELSVELLDSVLTAVDLIGRNNILTDVLLKIDCAQKQELLSDCINMLDTAERCKQELLGKFNLHSPSDSLPTVPEIEALLALGNSCPRNIPNRHGTSSHLRTIAETYHSGAKEVKRQLEVIFEIIRLLDLNVVCTDHLLRLLQKARRMLDVIDRASLLLRSERLLDESVRPVLKKRAKLCSELNDEQKRLSAIVGFSLEEDALTYKDMARILRSSSILERIFGSKYRAAMKFWRGSHLIKSNLGREEVAKVLDEIAAHLSAVRAFREDVFLLEICGESFSQLETDFETLLLVNKFGIYVTQEFPGSDESTNLIRNLLLNGSINSLDAFRSAFDENTMKASSFILRICSDLRAGTKQIDLEQLPLIYEEIGNWANKMSQQMELLRFGADTSSGELDSIVEASTQFDCKLEELTANQNFAELLGGGPSDFLEKSDLLRLTLETGIELSRLNLPTIILPAVVAAHHNGTLNNFEELCQIARTLLADIEGKKATLPVSIGTDSSVFFANNSALKKLHESLSTAIESLSKLPLWSAYCTIEKRCCALGLDPLLNWFYESSTSSSHLVPAFEVSLSRSLMQEAYKKYPELKAFSGTTQEEARSRFRKTDKEILAVMQEELRKTLSKSVVPIGIDKGPKKQWTDLALIRNEITKQRQHIPLRELFRRASSAVQQLKPCWLMSPGSVAQFLSPGDVEFDIVIIDEASQMLPEDAVGAIVRAKQAVIVGDPMQLPPTSFFNKLESSKQDDEDAEEFVDSESVLDLALGAFHPSRTLRWHYRSRHHSLIAFSNKHFYNGDLVLFPSTSHVSRVELVKVDGVYTPGKRVNIREIEVVANHVIDFMCNNPNLSLGVVTMNQSQREILLDEIDRLFTRNLATERYRAKWEGSLEPFFVKNLENVQGDERDVIFISTVYGPEEAGGKVAQRFGPINSAGGHRRLNVLFTRAKERVVLFSSMTSTDILVSDKSSRGVKVLKEYLEYAQTGELGIGTPTGREPDSDFEVHVANRLVNLGYEVDAQVGSAGYFIDLAVRVPGKENRYILGIECDGANYHSAKSTRDRDRLRQEVLEHLGWKIYRIWSTDWFSNADWEIQKLVDHIERIRP